MLMRLSLYVVALGLILSVTLSSAQTTPSAQTPPINPSTPASGIGDGAQSKSGNPVPPSSTSPAATGGVAGSASSSTAQSPDMQSSSGGLAALTDSDLESQIQNALSKEPTLTGDSPHVTVSGNTIELAGAVGTNKEKVTASRIVQSYAGSKKFVNKLTVGGRNEKVSPRAPSATSPDRNRQPGSANPATNPPDTANPPSTSRPPER
jgi:hypothetical protein